MRFASVSAESLPKPGGDAVSVELSIGEKDNQTSDLDEVPRVASEYEELFCGVETKRALQ